MAKKIRSWEEYDAVVKERQERFEEEVESELEELIAVNPFIKANRQRADFYRKQARGLYRIVRGQQVSVEEEIKERLTATEKELEEGIFKLLKPDLQPQAERTVVTEMVGSTLQDLAAYGVSVSKMPGGMLPLPEKNNLYARFVVQLAYLAAHNPPVHFVDNVPEAEHLVRHYHFPEWEQDIQRVTKVITELKKKKYISSQNASTLLQLLFPERRSVLGVSKPVKALPKQRAEPLHHPEETARTGNGEAVTAKTEITGGGENVCFPSEEQRRERNEYMAVLFGLGDSVAKNYLEKVTVEQLDDLHRALKEVVGEENISLLTQYNPDILLYPAENRWGRYLRTLTVVLGRIRKNGSSGIDLEERFGLKNNVERYADLEKLLELKAELFRSSGAYAEVAAPADEKEFDLEQYKDRLLQKAGLDSEMVRAFTEGKSSHFKGENYFAEEYFRKNAHGKVSYQKLGRLFRPVFEEMVRQQAITRKHKANPLYRLNPHTDEITNPYLREYMRVTLYKDQILAQEGQITPLIDLDEEEKRGEKPKP